MNLPRNPQESQPPDKDRQQWLTRLLYAFPCGAEVRHEALEHRIGALEPAPARGCDSNASDPMELLVFLSPHGEVCRDGCSCFKTYRQVVIAVKAADPKRWDKAVVPTRRKTDFPDGERQIAGIDDFNSETVRAIASMITDRGHLKPDSIPVKSPPSVENPQGGPKQGDSERDPVGHRLVEGGQP